MTTTIITDKTILKTISKPVELSDDITQLKEDMKQILHNSPYAVGLSAIQIGVPKRLICIKYIVDGKIDYRYFINPEIVEVSHEYIIAHEGCLSFTDKFVQTRRHAHITVDFLNEKFEHTIENFSELFSRALQHEIDHLNGILIFDNVYMSKAQQPNEKCKCNSGKKFKKCCGK